MRGFERYARVLRVPHVAPLLAATVIARLNIGISGLAVVLYLREARGSYAIAGAVAAALAAGIGLGQPLMGRLVDRRGQRAVLLPAVAAHCTGLLGLIGLTEAGAPTVALLACGLAAGSVIPPMSSVMRSLYPGLLRGEPALLTTAFAMDSVLIEMVFVAGPLIVAVLATIGSPAWGIVVAAACSMTGTLWFAAQQPSRSWAPHADAGTLGRLGALRTPGVITIVLATIPAGFCFGAVEVALPAFAEDEGNRAVAGVMLALWSAGSMAGGLWYGASMSDKRLGHRYLRFALVLPLGFLPLPAAPSVAAMGVLLFVAGICIAPLLSAGNQLVGELAPPAAATEAYTWPVTAIVVGVAAGNATSGFLSEHVDWRVAAASAAGAAILGAFVTVARRRTLTPA